MFKNSLPLILATIFFSAKLNIAIAQVPFTTSIKEKYTYYIEADPSSQYGLDFLRNAELEESSAAGLKEIALDSVGALFFKHNSITQDFIGDDGITRISSNLIFYKLYIYGNSSKDVRWHLPFFLISRLSSKYDSSNVSSSSDALDYEGSPVTVRFMPSGYFDVGDENTLYYGLVADYRGLNVVTSPGVYEYEHGFYLAGGFTYGGNGSASRLGSGEVETGVWTFSLMLEAFWSKPSVIKELYNTSEDYAVSLQGLLNFFISEDNPLNLKAGFQYFFTDPLNAEKFGLKVSIGSF